MNILHWYFYEIPNNAQMLLGFLLILPIVLGIGAFIDYIWN